MSVNASAILVLGWAVNCETVMKKEPRFNPKTGAKLKDVSKFSHRILRIGEHVLPVELMDNPVYDPGDVGLMFSSEDSWSSSRDDDEDDDIGEVTGMCYGQVVFKMSDSPFGKTEKGCNTVYPVLYEVSAKLKKFQTDHNLPEPTLFAELSFG